MRQTLQKDVLIVTLYGRGHWLALECQKKGYDVALLDLTPLMGEWSLEDLEGPFGVFESKKHTASQMMRLTDEGPLVLNDRGYVIWLKTGPLELKGPLGAFQIKKNHIPDTVIEYLHLTDGGDLSKLTDFLSQIENLPFEKNWLVHFAHQITSSVFMENTRGLLFGSVLPIMNSFYYRKFHKKKAKQNPSYSVLSSSLLKKNISLNGTKSLLESVRYQKGKQIKAQQIIWMLSSQETDFCFGKNAKVLFPKDIMTPKLYWTKYRLCFEKTNILESLPDHFVMLEDIYLPWMHDNLSIVQKTSYRGIIDVWMRFPYAQRFQKDYVQNHCISLQKHFQNRIYESRLNIQDWPREVLDNPNKIGPSIFPVYDFKERQLLKRSPLKNVIFEGPEAWTSLGWDGQFRSNRRTWQELTRRLK